MQTFTGNGDVSISVKKFARKKIETHKQKIHTTAVFDDKYCQPFLEIFKFDIMYLNKLQHDSVNRSRRAKFDVMFLTVLRGKETRPLKSNIMNNI